MTAFTRGPNFGQLLKTGEYSDLTLVCSGEEHHVHRVVVCSQSEVLATAIREPFEESRTGTITIKEFDADTVQKMVEFLYTGDYGSLVHQAEDMNDDRLASSVAPEEDEILQHVRLNSIADYYDIKALADLSKAKLRHASQNLSNETVLLDVAHEVLSRTGDTTLHDMLAEETAKNVRSYLDTDQLAELVGRFGVQILRAVVASEDELRLQIMHLQIELESEQARLKGAEKSVANPSSLYLYFAAPNVGAATKIAPCLLQRAESTAR